MILPGLREAWFVSWSRGSQLEPNDGWLAADPAVSLVPRPVSQAEEHSSADPGLAAWLPVITTTHNAGPAINHTSHTLTPSVALYSADGLVCILGHKMQDPRSVVPVLWQLRT